MSRAFRRSWRVLAALGCGLLLQASACGFDGVSLLNDTLGGIMASAAESVFRTALSELLKVSPGGLPF